MFTGKYDRQIDRSNGSKNRSRSCPATKWVRNQCFNILETVCFYRLTKSLILKR